jgi:hypothetical protein
MPHTIKSRAQNHEGPAFTHRFQRRGQAAFCELLQRFPQFTHFTSPRPQIATLVPNNQPKLEI